MDGGDYVSNLKLIKKKVLSEQKNNFWKACPRKLDYMPETPCNLGTPEKSKDNRIIKCPECPWWINSPDHNFCFWTFIKDKSNPDGSMKELVQSDLSKLFGWSSAKTHQILKESLEELKEAFKNHELTSELDDSCENYEMIDFSDLLGGASE